MKIETAYVWFFWIALFGFLWLRYYFHPAACACRAFKRIAHVMKTGTTRELTEYFERVLSSRRPLVRAFDRTFGAGYLNLLYASHLCRIGRPDDALPHCAPRPDQPSAIAAYALDLRVRILAECGRYDESRAAAAGIVLSTASLPEYYSGRLEDGLAIVRRSLELNPGDSGARFFGALILNTRGNFREAMELLLFDPPRPRGTSPLHPRPFEPQADYQATMDMISQAIYEETQAARFLMAAAISVAAEDVKEARWALEKSREFRGDDRAGYWLVQAEIAAVEGHRAEVDAHLARAREIGGGHPPSRSDAYRAAITAAWSLLRVKDLDAAQAALRTADQTALHPIEKHANAFLRAKALDLAGRPQEAAELYRRVVADGFTTAAAAHAAKSLSL